MKPLTLYYKLKHDIADYVLANDASPVDVVGVVTLLHAQIMKNPFQFVKDLTDETTQETAIKAAEKQ